MSNLGTVEAARGRWPGILQALGLDPKYLRNIHGPCPMCGGKDRWRFDDKLNGNWFCSRCGAGDGFALLQKMHGWTFKQAASEVDAVVGNCPTVTQPQKERTEDDKRKAIRCVLEGAGAVQQGSPVWLWLRNRCGDPGAISADLRQHPGLKHRESGGTHPAMLAIMRYPDGSGSSVHRTYLTPDGHKAAVDPVRKIMNGLPLAGSAVRLGPIQECIGIAEGIETAICASKLFGIPVWSCISANGIKTFEVPQGVRQVIVCADNDANFTGQEAAYSLAKRLALAGIAVEVRIPEQAGTDWADVFMQKQMLEVA